MFKGARYETHSRAIELHCTFVNLHINQCKYKNMRDRTAITSRGYSLHGDWFGGWNCEVNKRWIDNCVNIVDTDCDEGLLADPRRRNSNAKGLKIRPQYSGEMGIPGDAVLKELCPADKHFSGQTSVALCQPASM